MRYSVTLVTGVTQAVDAAKVAVEDGALIFTDEYLLTVAAFAAGQWSFMSRKSR